MEKGLIINEKTGIPLFFVIGMVPILVGGILWLASIDSKATAAQADAVDLKKFVSEINDRTIRIEEAVKWQVNQTKKRIKGDL